MAGVQRRRRGVQRRRRSYCIMAATAAAASPPFSPSAAASSPVPQPRSCFCIASVPELPARDAAVLAAAPPSSRRQRCRRRASSAAAAAAIRWLHLVEPFSNTTVDSAAAPRLLQSFRQDDEGKNSLVSVTFLPSLTLYLFPHNSVLEFHFAFDEKWKAGVPKVFMEFIEEKWEQI